jgi:CubicO group peptidase (beta-lactamase class C family)
MSQRFKWYASLLLLGMLGFFLVTPIPLANATGTPPLSAHGFQQLDALITSKMQQWHIPGMALSIVQGDQVVHSRGFGNADTSGHPVTPQTPFIIGSISKSLTATAIMQLVEQKKLALDTPILSYLPWLQFAGQTPKLPITIRQLLTHTSGISAFTSFGTLVNGQISLEQQVRNRTIMLDRQPGTTFEYADFNYQLLGLLIQVASQESYVQYVQQHIFTSLGMDHSFTSPQDAARHGLAQANTWAFGFPAPLLPLPISATDDPSGNLISSAGDLSQYMIAEMDGGRVGTTTLLSSADITTMQTPAIHMGGEGEREGYGMGWKTGEYLDTPGGVIQGIWHGGTTIGYNSILFMQPQQHWGVVMLFNINNLFINTLPFDPSEMLKQGVIQFLSGMSPSFYPGPSMQTFYLVADIILALATLIVLWPLFRLFHWQRCLRKRYSEQKMDWWQWLRLWGDLAWELVVPLLFFLGPPLLWHLSFQTFPLILLFEVADFGGWLLVMMAVLFITGVLRGILAFRMLHGPRTSFPTDQT